MWGDEQCDDSILKKKICVDVGGTTFISLASTLQKSPYLYKELDLESDYLFLDRDPVLFSYILSYLRTGKLFLSTDDKNFLDSLKHEAQFYGLSDLVSLVPKLYVMNPIHELVNEFKAVSKTKPRTRQSDGGGW